MIGPPAHAMDYGSCRARNIWQLARGAQRLRIWVFLFQEHRGNSDSFLRGTC